MKLSRTNRTILIVAVAAITVAGMLFLDAVRIGDFAHERAFFDGPSNIRLAAAFVLLMALVVVLLFILLRTGAAGAGQVEAAGEQVRTKDAGVREEAAPEESTSGEFLTDAADELRTTVGAMQEELEEILDEETPADKQHIQLLYDETDRLKRIIESMEQLSQVSSLARRREPVQVAPLLRDIVETTKNALPDKDIVYRLECAEDLTLQGDAECIVRILGNITDNAARFQRGAGSVTLTAERTGDHVVFSVQDTGPGIRRAQLPHIYERFFRGTGSGIGMGLAIAKELVDACGGTIDVQTEVNKGTTFTIHLPAD